MPNLRIVEPEPPMDPRRRACVDGCEFAESVRQFLLRLASDEYDQDVYLYMLALADRASAVGDALALAALPDGAVDYRDGGE